MASIHVKKRMMLLTEEWRKNNPPRPKQVPKIAPVASSSNSNVKKKPQSQNKGKGKAPATKPYSQGYQVPKIQQDAIEIYFGWPEKGGSQIKISKMISDIFDSILELYEAINDVKTHFSDTNSYICNNLKTNSLSLRQINQTLMCFEKHSRTIKTSDN
ncbi:hypothetical protein O181_069812 [Austropuccinia psidii MF-1]|uniref:Uncharacterized protein n=1 Tax=Austropuccinia psidii MF-1 TaxID=1389203 RepID=A0A9Q3I7N0_9BASI|nr:hypothetical protein [Austropuccinia psidii MF-1]